MARTKEEKEHLEKVKMLPCCVCKKAPPSDAHHCIGMEFGTGMGKKSSDFCTISLCKIHHQTGAFGIAVHNGTKTWEKNFKPQREYLEEVKRRLNDV